MPAPTTASSTRSTFWYPKALRPIGPKQSRRFGASAIVNGLNAVDFWMHADNPTYLIGCMRTQIANLWELALHSDLSQDPNNDQKAAVVMLLKECRDALYAYNPLTPQTQPASNAGSAPTSGQASPQTAGQAFAQPMAFAPTSAVHPGNRRTASTQSQIESNAKAALGTMAYLQDPNIFGTQGPALYAFIQYRLQQVASLMEGSVSLSDVVSERQRLVAQQQTQGLQPPQTVPYQSSSAAYQGGGAVAPSSPSAPNAAEAAVPSPVAGLKLEGKSLDGIPNKDQNGQETVGSSQDWFSTYGTTPQIFAARCSRWLKANGGSHVTLVSHLRQNTVPENVIRQTLPYV